MIRRGGICLALLVIALLLLPLVVAWLPADAASPRSAPPIDWHKLLISLGVATAAAGLAVLIGSCLALLLSTSTLPASQVWTTCCLLPFLAPPTVWALGQVYCFGPGGLLETWLGDGLRPLLSRLDQGHYLSTTLVLGQTYSPLALFVVGRAAGKLSRSGLESALMSLPRMRLLAWLLVGLRRELTSAFLLTFALALGNFATAHVLQCRLYAIDIYMQAANYLDPQGALFSALPLLAICLTAAFLFAWWEPAGGGLLAHASRRAKLPLSGCWQHVANGCLLGWIALTIGLPIAAMVMACGSPAKFLTTAAAALPETETTLVIGCAAALLACVAGAIIALGLPRRGARTLEAVAIAPIAVPALVVALAYAQFYNRTSPVDLSWLGSTSGLVVLGLAFRSWPFATRVLRGGRLRTPAQWGEAARLANLSPLRGWLRIQLPLLADSIGAALVLSFVIAIGDLELSQMLCAPGEGTLALRLFTYLHFGPTHVSASLALLQLLLAVVPVCVYLLLFDRRLGII